MSEGLTKLSGPELVARARMIDGLGGPCGWRPEYVEELARRAEEDTRVWQRNLERERDAWRSLAERRERELTGRIVSSVGGRVIELERERDELREQCESWKRKAALPRKSYPVTMDLTPDCESIADSPYVAAVAVAHGKALATQAVIDRDDSIAQGMSTAELVAEVKRQRETRVAAVEALAATKANMERMERDLLLRLGDAETLADSRLSIVSRLQDSLNETRGELHTLRNHANELEDKNGCLRSEIKQAREWADAELIPKAAEYDRLKATVANQRKELAIHLRETLATLKAVEALADTWSKRHLWSNASDELREVLNGKR